MEQSMVILATILFALSGCQVSLDRAEVIGSWECRRGPRVSCIDVNENGTYRHLITLNGGEELSSTSTWTWEPVFDERMAIVFERFHHIKDDGSGIRDTSGFWPVLPTRTVLIGSPKLIISDDIDIAFIKREAPCPQSMKR